MKLVHTPSDDVSSHAVATNGKNDSRAAAAEDGAPTAHVATTDIASPSVRSARRTLGILVEALLELSTSLDDSFEHAVASILRCEGRVVLTGLGKSGLICQKIAATLASTGTPAQFLHAAEGLHGDLGIVTARDLVIAVSYSGETAEVVQLLPALKRFGVPTIAITGNRSSTLAQSCDLHLCVAVPREACPLGLAPTSSTTATLAMGDALAVALLEARGFTKEDFAAVHPGGSLGKRLLLRIGDVMHPLSETPLVTPDVPVFEALFEITGKRFGVAGIVDEGGRLIGVFTDGDLRRLVTSNNEALFGTTIGTVMTRGGQRIDRREMAASALRRMEEMKITSLFVVDGASEQPDRVVGIVHLHDLLNSGVA